MSYQHNMRAHTFPNHVAPHHVRQISLITYMDFPSLLFPSWKGDCPNVSLLQLITSQPPKTPIIPRATGPIVTHTPAACVGRVREQKTVSAHFSYHNPLFTFSSLYVFLLLHTIFQAKISHHIPFLKLMLKKTITVWWIQHVSCSLICCYLYFVKVGYV